MRARRAARSAPGGVFADRSARYARRQRVPRTVRDRPGRSMRSIVSKGVTTRRSTPSIGRVKPDSVTIWQSSNARTKQIGTQALLTWLPHPGTAIYLGYNNDLQNLDRGLCSRLMTGGCDRAAPALPRSANYLNDGRQIFLKVSYLLRF